jgi:hypothetical protein
VKEARRKRKRAKHRLIIQHTNPVSLELPFEARAMLTKAANKPMSDAAETDPDELYQAAITVMKHLLVQTHNSAGVAAGTHNHESVSDEPMDAHVRSFPLLLPLLL